MFSIVFSGKLGADVEFAYSKTGEPYAKFSVAVYQGKEKEPLWVRCVIFGRVAEMVAARMPKKGEVVIVQADRPFEVSMYEKKAGGVGYSVELKASWVECQKPEVAQEPKFKNR